MSEKGKRYFFTSGLQEVAGSIFMFTNFWNKHYPNTLVSCNYSDKNEVLFPVLGITPLHRSMLFLLRNVV